MLFMCGVAQLPPPESVIVNCSSTFIKLMIFPIVAVRPPKAPKNTFESQFALSLVRSRAHIHMHAHMHARLGCLRLSLAAAAAAAGCCTGGPLGCGGVDGHGPHPCE